MIHNQNHEAASQSPRIAGLILLYNGFVAHAEQKGCPHTNVQTVAIEQENTLYNHSVWVSNVGYQTCTVYEVITNFYARCQDCGHMALFDSQREVRHTINHN